MTINDSDTISPTITDNNTRILNLLDRIEEDAREARSLLLRGEHFEPLADWELELLAGRDEQCGDPECCPDFEVKPNNTRTLLTQPVTTSFEFSTEFVDPEVIELLLGTHPTIMGLPETFKVGDIAIVNKGAKDAEGMDLHPAIIGRIVKVIGDIDSDGDVLVEPLDRDVNFWCEEYVLPVHLEKAPEFIGIRDDFEHGALVREVESGRVGVFDYPIPFSAARVSFEVAGDETKVDGRTVFQHELELVR